MPVILRGMAAVLIFYVLGLFMISPLLQLIIRVSLPEKYHHMILTSTSIQIVEYQQMIRRINEAARFVAGFFYIYCLVQAAEAVGSVHGAAQAPRGQQVAVGFVAEGGSALPAGFQHGIAVVLLVRQHIPYAVRCHEYDDQQHIGQKELPEKTAL